MGTISKKREERLDLQSLRSGWGEDVGVGEGKANTSSPNYRANATFQKVVVGEEHQHNPKTSLESG